MKNNDRHLLAWFVFALVALLAVICWCIIRQSVQLAEVRRELHLIRAETVEKSVETAVETAEKSAKTAAETAENVEPVRQIPPENVGAAAVDLADTAALLAKTGDAVAAAAQDPADETYVAAVVGDLEYVLRVLTAEAGSDELLCGCVAQCLYNACERYGWTLSPAEMMRKYQYTGPLTWHSEAAERAYDEVFCSGVTYDCVGKATVFYAPAYGASAYHESQRFVFEYGGVRFFEETGEAPPVADAASRFQGGVPTTGNEDGRASADATRAGVQG
jgi:hypothetical protein